MVAVMLLLDTGWITARREQDFVLCTT